MLVSLHVKNLALIDETEVYFGNGLNILTGETGAGKSIIIGSVNLALGARADKDMIRTGAEYALVELVFEVQREDQLLAIQSMDIPIEEDGTLLIQRKIMSNRNMIKICGENGTTKMLKDLAGILIDIHGQHEHQSLFHIKKHMELLDEFAKEELWPIKNEIALTYKEYLNCKQDLEKVFDQTEKKKEISLAEFEIEEIERANIQIGEDDRLEADFSKMVNRRKIMESIGMIYSLTGYDNKGAGELVGRAVREMKGVLNYDNALEPVEEVLSTIDELMNDFNRNLADYIADMKFDEQDFREVEERLNTLNHLKSKYGLTLESIISYQNDQMQKLEQLQNYESYKESLLEKFQKIKGDLDILCDEASVIRHKYAAQLSVKMTNALLDLNFMDVNFKIQVRKNLGQYHMSGFDEVEFLIATNPGEPLKSLCNVASGGELSRIMLALKTVIAEKDAIETLIFDEIDAGISGKTAWKVSEKLALLGKNHQIICITHLPQIAAMADTHFVIAKKTVDGTAKTSIKEIKENEEIEELARLLGGDVITEAVINNAKEMKDLAVNSKQFESKI